MMFRLSRLYRRRDHARREEADKCRRLDAAETVLRDLKARARRAEAALNERQARNHWQDAVDEIIRGARRET